LTIFSPKIVLLKKSDEKKISRQAKIVDDDNDEERIDFSVALSPKTTRTRNNKPKQ